MGRKKGSLNKKIKPVQIDFIENKSFDEKTEVCMTKEIKEDSQELNEKPIFREMNQKLEIELDAVQQEIDQARIELERTRLEIEAKKQQLKSMPIVDVKPAESPAIAIKDNSLRDKIADMKARDSIQVTGKFYNLRVKGQSVKLPYLKYGDEPVKWWNFDHGKVYTIPKGFADQINGGTESDPYHYTPHFIKNDNPIINPDEPESGIHAVDTSDKKFSFVPLNF